jgi:PAS domain S-box-containing protein
MDLLPDAVTIVTATHKIVYANAACTHLLGADRPAAVVGQSVWEFIHPDDLPTVLAHLNADDRRRSVQYRIQRLDGEERVVETVMVPILHDGQPAMLSTARDMSHQHHMRRALTNTQDLFHHIFEAVPAALVLARTDDGICVDANAAFAELTGCPTDQVTGRQLERCDFWRDPDAVRRLLHQPANGGPMAPTYLHLRRPGGEPRVAIGTFEAVTLRGKPHALGVLLDITDGERTRRQLLQISKAVESTSDAVALLEPTGRVTYQNAAFSELVGCDAATLNETHGGPAALIGEQKAEAAVRAAMNGGHSWRGDLELHGADDAPVPVALRVDSVRDDTGTIVGIVWILSDVSERRAVEQQLIAAKERAEEASRIKSAILTNITHEVRTPLTVILGFTSIMRKGISAKYERFVDLIERSGQRLLLTLDSMLDLAQLEAGTLALSPEPVNLVEVAHGVIDTLQPLADQKGIDLRLRTVQKAMPAYQDHRLLVRVVHNLLDNALKFTTDGYIEVALRRSDDGTAVHLTVEDTGVGIDASFVTHIFDEFAQESSGLERSYQGSGLGLTVSRRLIERVGGRIQVDSTKGEGTTFHVTLPVDIRPQD